MIKILSTIFNLIFIIYSFLFLLASYTHAVVNPLSYPNNRYGIHIISEHDIDDASLLVNSSGGSWGYVTMVIREDERDEGRWQTIFDRLREKKLIPVIRIATSLTSKGWRAPSIEDVDEWVRFLSSLNWVIQNRYIILFNEPNHSKEWGGTIDPESYTSVVRTFYDKLKRSSEDFFILPAGLDLTAVNTSSTMDAKVFFDRMYQYDHSIFTLFDGWTSHSYPNPHFSGSPYDTGKQSIQGFLWEKAYLEKYGLDPNIPVFITETGWPHKEGIDYNFSYYPAEYISNYFTTAFSTTWNNKDIAMVSPFILNYPQKPFDHFSWKKSDNVSFYPQYQKVLGLSKVRGNPPQIDTAKISIMNMPNTLAEKGSFFLKVKITNTGQKIWDDTYRLSYTINNKTKDKQIVFSSLAPFKSKQVKIRIDTPNGNTSLPIQLVVTTNSNVLKTNYSTSIPIEKYAPESNLKTALYLIWQNIAPHFSAFAKDTFSLEGI